MKDVLTEDYDYNLWVLLSQANDVVFNAREEELSQYGIPAMQARVLFLINSIGSETTPAQISRWIFRKPHSVSGILFRMEDAGLIKKTKDLHKKNLVRVTITEKGQQIFEKSLKRKSVHKIMSVLTDEERQQLQSIALKLRAKGLRDLRIDPKKVPFPKFSQK